MGRGIRGITQDFYESHGRDFQKRCFSWLKFIHPQILDSKDLGEVDKEGVDLYIFSNDRTNYLKAFQCKGFEKSFGESQFNQCKNSIEKFRLAGVHAKEYFLIINTQIDDVYSKKLNLELNTLIASNVANEVFLFNSGSFIKYYDKELREVIKEKALESNKKFYDDYTSIMEQNFYFEKVPFKEKEIKNFSPLNFILNSINDVSNIQGIKGKNYFLVSEFGFGKTTTLLQLHKRLIEKDFIPIYIPITLLDNNSFLGTSHIARAIFKLIFSDVDFDESDKIIRFSSESMKSILQNDKNFILMFDGLDEHLQLYKFEGLKNLFNSTAEFKAICIFSFRQSYWEERFEDFKIALSKKGLSQDYIFLLEWGEGEIIQYIKLFIHKNQSNFSSSEILRLQQLLDLVKNDLYGVYYGDIPKRPLFLEMILRDVVTEEIKQRNISELYLNYFLEKFDRDLKGQFETISPQREIPEISLGVLKEVLIDIHETAAKSCIKNDAFGYNDEALIENVIHEKDIRQKLVPLGLSNDIGKLLAISLLTPISKRGNMNMKLKFAHKSFMEFFIARVVCKELLNSSLQDDIFGPLDFYTRYKYPESILNFLGSCIDNEIKNIGESRVKEILNKRVNETKLNSTLLYVRKKLTNKA